MAYCFPSQLIILQSDDELRHGSVADDHFTCPLLGEQSRRQPAMEDQTLGSCIFGLSTQSAPAEGTIYVLDFCCTIYYNNLPKFTLGTREMISVGELGGLLSQQHRRLIMLWEDTRCTIMTVESNDSTSSFKHLKFTLLRSTTWGIPCTHLYSVPVRYSIITPARTLAHVHFNSSTRPSPTRGLFRKWSAAVSRYTSDRHTLPQHSQTAQPCY